MSNLLKRIITGLIFGIIVIGAIYFGVYSFSLLVVAVSFFCLKEYFAMELSTETSRARQMAILFSLLPVVLQVAVVAFDGAVGLINILAPLAITALVFSSFDLFTNKSNPIVGKVLTANLLISIPLAYFLGMSEKLVLDIESGNSYYTYAYKLPMAVLFITWANDVGAYFVGKFFGKRKLIPFISPNKTWEGFWGGLIMSVIAAFSLSSFFHDILRSGEEGLVYVLKFLFLGASISVFAVVGDLYQSYTKRRNNVKDSGNILPGHGGMWDRLDGLVFAVYGYYFAFYIFQIV